MAVQWIALHLTDRCQLDCQHCLRDPAKQPSDLPLAIIERVLDEARVAYRASHVALTGGEPTLHPEFPRVLDAIVGRGYGWHLVTNGRRFPAFLATIEAVPARRAGLTAVDLSLDGADEAVHDDIREHGSFREVMAAATLCSAKGIPFLLQMSVNAINAH